MGSFVRCLKQELTRATSEQEELRETLKEKIEQLSIEQAEKKELAEQVDRLSPFRVGVPSHVVEFDSPAVPLRGYRVSAKPLLGVDVTSPRLSVGALRVPMVCQRCGRTYAETRDFLEPSGQQLCPDCREE